MSTGISRSLSSTVPSALSLSGSEKKRQCACCRVGDVARGVTAHHRSLSGSSMPLSRPTALDKMSTSDQLRAANEALRAAVALLIAENQRLMAENVALRAKK